MSKPLIVDLHIHSHYSRATSPEMNIGALYRWGKIKGINIIGTGDFTHPAWFAEVSEKLELTDGGLYKLKDKFVKEEEKQIPQSCRDNIIRFIPTVEISNIYSRHDKVRKLHNVIVVPTLKVAAKINAQLDKIGNITHDGRPILGMDSYDLLKMTLNSDPDSLFIPAHIWTPWFAMFGSKSGFDSIGEAFGDLAGEIKAVETGLSSDPFMNWRLSQLDGLTLVSHSDAHSPRNLGREANMINAQLDYLDIINAIKTNDDRFVGTIEFYPQEGKYHFDGHRTCQIQLSPQESLKLNGICPKCAKPLTLGVDYRVNSLADRAQNYRPKKHKKVEYIIPLTEMIKEIEGVKSVTSKAVTLKYQQLIDRFGNEFDLLRNISSEEVGNNGFTKYARALEKMRQGDIYINPGYDGVFGVAQVFKDGELNKIDGRQIGLL